MWILVEVDEPHDVGKNEKTRYVLSDHPTIADNLLNTAIMAVGNKVHPATRGRFIMDGETI